jgi:hypothetical protein
MAVLDRQTITVPLGGGLETELADKLLPVGKLLELENAIINQTGRVTKRPGNVALGTLPPVTPYQLATLNGALVSLGPNGSTPIAVYSEGTGGWTSATLKTDLRGPINTNRIPVFSGTAASADTPSVAYNAANNVYAVVFDGTTARTIFIDAKTGARLYENSTSPMVGPGTRPRVIAVGTSIVVAYHEVGGGGGIFIDVYSSANIAAGAGPTTNLVSTVAGDAANPFIDLISLSPTTVDIAYRSNVGTLRRLTVTVATGAVTLNVPITTAALAAINPALGLAWMTDPAGSGKLAIQTINNITGVQVQWDLTAGLPAISYVMAGAAGDYGAITGHTISNAATGEFVVLTHRSSPNAQFHMRTVAGGIVTGDFIRGISLRSKTFHFGSDDYVVGSYSSSVGTSAQRSYFLFRVSPTHLVTPVRTPLARIMMWQGNGILEHGSMLSSVVLTGVSTLPTFVTALVKVVAIESSGVAFSQDVGTDIVGITFGGPMQRGVEAADGLAMGGGSLLAFDGSIYAEDGFPIYPEAPTTPGVETAGGLTAGTYHWRAVYRYTDTNGRVTRSRPSAPLDFVIIGAASRITVTVVTSRFNSRPNATIQIELYRTIVNGPEESYRLVTTLANDPTIDTVSFSDGVTDLALQAGENLYTSVGFLANDAPPGTRATLFFRDRLWVLSDDDRVEAWYSDLVSPGIGFTWSERRIIRIDDEYGDLTALAGLGQSTIFFKREAIYAINGDGPNSIGQGGYNDPQRIEEGLGCVDPRSVVIGPPGIFFQSTRGIWLLSEGGNPTYVGAPVARYNGLTIVASILCASKAQVRFYTSVGTILVYDYNHQQWSIDSGAALTAATAWNGLPAFTAGGLTLREDTTGTVFTDAGNQYSLKIVTPWLSIAGLQGVERLYLMEGVGDVRDAHTLSVSLQYDNDRGPTSTPQTKAFAALDDWEWSLKPARQLATAIKVTMIDTYASTPTAGFTAVALALTVGVEPTHLKRFLSQVKSLL